MLRETLLLTSFVFLASCASTSTPTVPAEAMMTQEIAGAEHAALAPFVGSFKARVAFEIPGQPEQVSYGSYDVKWMGSMWLVGSFKSDSLEQPFEGTALIGYDLQTKQYTNWWFDTMMSAPQISRGTWDPATRQMLMHSDPVHGMAESRIVTQVNADGSVKSEVFAPGPNTDEMRVMYIEYTRR